MSKDQAALFTPGRGRRRSGRLRRGLDVTLATLEDPPAALVALARVQADLLDGLAARHLEYTDNGVDPPFGMLTAEPRLHAEYGNLVAALIADGSTDASDDLERFLSTLALDPTPPGPPD